MHPTYLCTNFIFHSHRAPGPRAGGCTLLSDPAAEVKAYLGCCRRSPHGVVSFADPAPPWPRPHPSDSRCRSCSRWASSSGTSSSLHTSGERCWIKKGGRRRKRRRKKSERHPNWNHIMIKRGAENEMSLLSYCGCRARIRTLLMKTLIPSWKISCSTAA